MSNKRLLLCVSLVLFALSSVLASAQTNCQAGAGRLRSDQPSGISVSEIVQKFTAHESHFKAARCQYTYSQDITVQTLADTGRSIVDGEYRQTMTVFYDEKGRRKEQVTFAPQSTLRRIYLTTTDLEDFRELTFFGVTSEDLPNYEVLYIGQQTIDELDTYVFDVAPRTIRERTRYFQGRIWVEKKDLAVVKTCGKSVPDTVTGKKNKLDQSLTPKFVTYREHIDGLWLPTYSRSDDFLYFASGQVRVHEVIKFTDYRKATPGQQSTRGTAFQESK